MSDPLDSFHKRLAQTSTSKMDALNEASAQKIASLRNLADRPEVQDTSWVGGLGLDANSTVGSAVNLGANVISGASRFIGQNLSTLYSTEAGMTDASVTQADTEAYNRYKLGQATAADIQLLNTKRPTAKNNVDMMSAKASMSATGTAKSPMEAIDYANSVRKTARNINEFFNLDSIKQTDNKEVLSQDLGDTFNAGASKVASGWKNNKVGDVASGITDLLMGAGEAVFKHPMAVTEYIAENAPQLMVGALGTAGKAAMASSNIGYAADYYQKGVENFAAENQGQLPSVDQRREIAAWAASLAVAEQAGDMVGLGAMKLGGKATKDAAKASLKQSLLGTLKAGAEGFATEAATEGYQTYAEGQAEGKPVSGADIYAGAVIGGLSGGALSGGVRTIAQVAGATPEQQEAKAEQASKKVLIADAIAKNTPEVFLDPTTKQYDPSIAVGVLNEQNRKQETSIEQKFANVTKAQEIIDNLTARHNNLLEQVKSENPEEAKKAKEELSKVVPKLKAADTAWDGLYSEFQISLNTAMAKKVEPTTKEDADSVINLSMASIENMDGKRAIELADDTSNSLSNTQRDYLRTFSEARQLENQLSSMGKVANEILHGSDKNVGISQYRSRIGAALMTGNDVLAYKQVAQMRSFAEGHQAKAEAAAKALAAYGEAGQVFNDGTTWQAAAPGTFSTGKLRAGGGLSMVKPGFVANLKVEAKAIATTLKEMEQAVAIKFAQAPKAEVQSVSPAVTTPPSPAQTLGSPASLFREKREREGRVEEDKSSSPEKTRKSPEENEKTEEITNNSSTLATEPTSEPSVTSLAGARGDTVPSTASVARREKENTQEEVQQEVAEQQAEAPAKAPVAEATPAVEIDNKEQSSVDVLGLASKKSKPEEEKTYQQKNLVADYLTVQVGSDDGTQRPLAKVPDFLAVLASNNDVAKQFLKNPELVDTHADTIKSFISTAQKWESDITKNLVIGNVNKDRINPEFFYKDVMQYLINEDGDVSQNVKTAIAYAGFSWVAENANKSAFNTPEEINAILRRDEDASVSSKEWDVLGLVGARESVVINSLGQRAVAALGLKSTANTPQNLIPQLESAMGAHVMKLLLDKGILQRTIIDGKTMRELTKDNTTRENADFKFIAIARNEQGKAIAEAAEMSEAIKGSQGILDKMFSVESGLKYPGFTPMPFNQKTTRNTNQAIPSVLVEAIKKENAAPHKINQSMWDLVQKLKPEAVLTMAGKEEIDETVHTIRVKSLEAKNAGLEREYDRMMEFFSSMQDQEQPIYFEHSVWKQQRVGIATNVINPQSSKIHRHMIYCPEWETTIDLNDQVAVDNFMLRVGEGLGVKTDKQGNIKSLNDVQKKLADPKIQAAITALRKSVFDGIINDEDQQAIVDGVVAGGENFHTLSALMGMAYYEQAKETKQSSFTTQMMGEVDGVTNGPMLSHLALGAASSVNQLFELLNKGGFYQIGSSQEQYNLWREVAGHLDLYETTTSHMVKEMAALNIDSSLLASIYAFTGSLTEGDKVVKAGRDIIKTPLTAMVFGSSVPSAIDSMADRFIEQIYAKIEDLAKGKGDTKVLVQNLNNLGLNLNVNIQTEELMKSVFTANEVSILKDAFKTSIGVAVEETMKKDFETFLDQRTEFNNTAQLAFEVYNAAYTKMREAYINELMDSGELAFRTPKQGKDQGKRIPLHDLTTKQEATLKKRLAGLAPIQQTVMSKRSGQLNAGVLIAKSDRKLSEKDTYSGSVQFGTPFKDNKAHSVGTHAYERSESSPGVAMLPISMHSLDAGISMPAGEKISSLNVHDARGAGVNAVKDVAVALNQATWNAMLEYSPASEMVSALLRVVRGVAGLIDNDTLPDGVGEALVDALTTYAEKHELSVEGVLEYQATVAKGMAYRADDMKLQAMEQMAAIDQYALEGGNYQVTSTDRAAATKARSALTQELSSDDRAALDKVTRALKPFMDAKAQQVPANVAPKGKPAIKSDARLVKYFTEQPLRTVVDVAQELKKYDLTGFQSKLLAAMTKVLGSKDTFTGIRFVTPATVKADVLAAPKQPSRAWFVSKNGKNEIYVLSPDYKDSGLTTETLLHEMMHATVAQSIATATGEVKELVNELEILRNKASAIVQTNKLKQFEAAVTDVQELVAWGMTNPQFQQVLDSIQMETNNNNNSWISGLKSFIDTLVSLVFGKNSEAASTGMQVLITNVAGLMKVSSTKTPEVGINQSMATGVEDLTTVEIFEGLGYLSGTAVSPTFGTQLRELLDTIVATVHGPYGVFKAQTVSQAQAAVYNVSKALQSGLPFTEQEAFMTETVEATIKAVMDTKDGSTTAIYKELQRLYAEARNHLKPSDFTNPAMYDFIFKIEGNAQGRSDYLARFAALGLTNEAFNKLLDFGTTSKMNDTTGLTMLERIHAWFDNVLTYINSKVTKTFEGQHADEKLKSLVTQLVSVENKQRSKISKAPSMVMTQIDNIFQGTAQAAKDKIAKYTSAPFFQNSGNAFVRATGKITSMVAQDRIDNFLTVLEDFRNEHFKGRHGLLSGIINEARGSNEHNLMFFKLLRLSKHSEGTRKELIDNTSKFVLKGFTNDGKDLTEEHKKVISSVILRGDMAALMTTYSMSDLVKITSDNGYLNQQIKAHVTQLSQFKFAKAYDNMSKQLGYKMATGLISGANVVMNAQNIANLLGTKQANKVDATEVERATKVIDSLVSLYALYYQNQDVKNTAATLLKNEMAGVESVLRLHTELQKQSKERIFQAAGTLQMKGYVPEVYNPYVTMVVADESQEEELIAQGYTKQHKVPRDKADKAPQQTIYTIRDGGMNRYATGIMSMTGKAAKGTKAHNGNMDLLSVPGLMNNIKMDQLVQAKQAEIDELFTKDIEPSLNKDAHMAPVFNAAGDVVNYRYMMTEANKDELLERENRFEHLMGVMAGSIFDKETTKSQNHIAIEALKEQYNKDFTTRASAYIKVGPNSTDPEMREIYRLLPEDTKQSIREVWGSNNMMVRVDLLDINFGYRKLSVTDAWGIPESERSMAQQVFVEFVEGLLKVFGREKKAALYLRRIEDVWQALVHEAKDTLVVKSGITLMGNFMSNLSELIWFGVPMTDIVKHHRTALKGVMSYRRDTKELFDLETKKVTGYAVDETRIAQLKDSLVRNPVQELIEAGLMPTIVEDVASDEDQYSYKSRFTKTVDDVVGNVNEHVLDVGKFLVMAHDTPLYRLMSQGTQVSDFLARYTLYQHKLNQQDKNGVVMAKDEAIQLVTDAFVNYDVPSHRALQYANDIGLVYFSKYYLRIQKVIALLYKEAPGRALMLLTAGHFLDFLPMLTHSAVLQRIGNPFSMGAFEAIGAVDELATVNALMSPFR
jgi:hypothetical protein